MRRFDLLLPGSVDDCLRILADRGPEAKLVAGGTDLLPQMKSAMLKPAVVVDLSGISELRRLERGPRGGLLVGAAVTARTLEQAGEAGGAFRALADGGALVGSVQVRNLATVGGNLCNAAPSADMAPPFLALDAEAEIASLRGRRRVPLASFFLGVRKTVLAPDELLVSLVVPGHGPGSGGQYLRHTPRRELDIAVVGVASQLTVQGGVCARARIVLASVAPVPVHATAAEQSLTGQPVTEEAIERAAVLAVQAAKPISDQRGSADFRRHLVRVLTRRTLQTALQRTAA